MQSEQVQQVQPRIIAVPESREGIAFENTPLNDTGTMGIVMLVFFLMAVIFRRGYKYVSDFSHHMFSVRKRQNAFEDHTMNETLMMVVMLVNTCIMVGIMLHIGINYYYPEFEMSKNVFKSVGYLSLLMGVYLSLQLLMYRVLGYVFSTDAEDTRLWIDGFNASQSMLGLLLFPIVFIGMLIPGSISFMPKVAVLMYVCARLVFVSKGFRIFFNNISSCVYFILYLCTVEIVPVFMIYKGAIYLSGTIV
ncbi:MAG: DUF4271 domain-containing protein [Muribaculaceae bacterium]|nr:DUF4271 domain-containing protein [Muribaculaceae bacterium]MBQ7942422.1 DUF4271 domain-containing protein [Muribaculaceae bacterium]